MACRITGQGKSFKEGAGGLVPHSADALQHVQHILLGVVGNLVLPAVHYFQAVIQQHLGQVPPEEKSADPRLRPGPGPGSAASPAGSHSEPGDPSCAGVCGRHGPGYQPHVHQKPYIPEKFPGQAHPEGNRTFLHRRDSGCGPFPPGDSSSWYPVIMIQAFSEGARAFAYWALGPPVSMPELERSTIGPLSDRSAALSWEGATARISSV